MGRGVKVMEKREDNTYDGADERNEVVLEHGALHTRKIRPLDIILPILVPTLLLQELEVRETYAKKQYTNQ